MATTFDRLEDKRNISEAEDQWDSPIDFSPRSNTYALMRALLSVNDRVDEDLESIYEQTHVDSATGEELEQFGKLVNLNRESGEGDPRYRARIKAAFRASTIGTTYDQFVEFSAAVLNTNVQNVNFSTSYEIDPGIITVGADSDVYESLDLQPTDVEELLGRGVPAGHEVVVVEGGTFRLKSDGESDDPTKGLTADDIDSGGTLAADLV